MLYTSQISKSFNQIADIDKKLLRESKLEILH